MSELHISTLLLGELELFGVMGGFIAYMFAVVWLMSFLPGVGKLIVGIPFLGAGLFALMYFSASFAGVAVRW